MTTMSITCENGFHDREHGLCVHCVRDREKKARENVMIESAKAVCPDCRGCCPNYDTKAYGPNSAGNYVHETPEDVTGASARLCGASSIWAMIYFERGSKGLRKPQERRKP